MSARGIAIVCACVGCERAMPCTTARYDCPASPFDGGRGRGRRMEVRAPMAGKIIDVVVEPGATVEADDDLVVVESMKMEIPIGSPQAGAVAAIHVAVGDTVNE